MKIHLFRAQKIFYAEVRTVNTVTFYRLISHEWLQREGRSIREKWEETKSQRFNNGDRQETFPSAYLLILKVNQQRGFGNVWSFSPTECFSISSHNKSCSSSAESLFLGENGRAAPCCLFVDSLRAAVISGAAVRSHRGDKSNASQECDYFFRLHVTLQSAAGEWR